MIRFHKIWLIVTALVGIPIAGLGLLLFVPAVLDKSWAASLLLLPTGLVVWAFACHIRIFRNPTFSPSNINHLATFYLTVGAVSLWSSTWTFTREGHTGRMFSPTTSIAVACFFMIPLAQLIYERSKKKHGRHRDGYR